MNFALRTAGIVLFVALCMAGAPAGAEEGKLPETLMLRFGGYAISDLGVIGRLDANNLPVGTYIDFQETLGGESRATVARLDGLYRFSRKHGLGFSWYALTFDGSRFLTRDIIWSGVTYSASTTVNSKLRFDVYKANYQYSLFHNEEAELGVSVGFHILKTFAGIEAVGIGKAKSEAVTAPLPVFGLNARYNFTPKFSAYYDYQFFFINYEDRIKGGLQDFLLGAEYRLFRNVALGAAYNKFALSMTAKGDDATIYLDAKWNGGMLYGALYF